MNSKIARREFLKRSAIAFGAVAGGSILSDALFGEIFARACAGTAPIMSGSNYIHLTMPGGPPRWMLDQLLTPAGITSANFVQGGFGTVLTSSSKGFVPQYSVDKHVVNGKTIYLPPVWNMGLAAQDFTTLLPNTLFVRGMNMEINSHPLSNARQVSPAIGGFSLNGVTADASGCPIPCVADMSSNASQAFKSKKGFSGTPVNYTINSSTNPASALLAPFNNYMANRTVNSPSRAPAQSQVLAAFDSYAGSAGLSNSALAQMYDNAIQMVDTNVYQSANAWSTVYAKYLAIVNEAVHPAKGTLPGIFDQAIATNTSGTFMTPNGNVTLADARDMIIASSTPPTMAANFALMEMMIGRLTSSMVLSLPALAGTMVTSTVGTTCYHDQHQTGSSTSTILTTLFYRAFLGCMTQLVTVLKSEGIFNNTVIHLGGEFSRSPRGDGSGSDHGYNGSGTTVISGKIGNVAAIGNIAVNSGNSTYPGTWGVGAAYALDGFVRPIQVNDVAHTISKMLGVADVTTNGMNLLAQTGSGLWLPRLEEANNV